MNHRTVVEIERTDGCVLHLCHFSLQDSFTIECRDFKKCTKSATIFWKLCPFSSAQGGHKRLSQQWILAKVTVDGRACIIIGNGWRGQKHQAPVKHSRQTHITPHLLRWESWVGPIAWCHRGNKLPKIGTRAGNGFYWRTNQGGHFSGAQFRFWLDSYWHQGYQCVSYWEV